MLGSNFLALPMHAGGFLVIHLNAVNADVALAGFRIACDHTWERNEASGIIGPALKNGKVEQREFVFEDDFLARAGGDGLRKELAHLSQHGEHFYFVEESLRRLHVHEMANAVRDFIQRIDFESEFHATLRAELIDEHLRTGVALYILEEQRWPA